MHCSFPAILYFKCYDPVYLASCQYCFNFHDPTRVHIIIKHIDMRKNIMIQKFKYMNTLYHKLVKHVMSMHTKEGVSE